MNPIKKITNELNRTLYKMTKTQKEILRLSSEKDKALKSLAKAISAVREHRVPQEEKKWINRIESMRSRLNASPEKISIMDYGAETAVQKVKTVGEICRKSSTHDKWGLLLFKLIREFKALVHLELGTCLGVSTAYQAAALELNRRGQIVSLEGAESLAALAKKNLENLGIQRATIVTGRFQDTLENVLHEQKHIDFAFIDGHHDEFATLSYFKQILPFLTDDAILVFDDISWSKGMERAWNTVIEDKHIKASVDLFKQGICVVTKSPGEKHHFKIAI